MKRQSDLMHHAAQLIHGNEMIRQLPNTQSSSQLTQQQSQQSINKQRAQLFTLSQQMGSAEKLPEVPRNQLSSTEIRSKIIESQSDVSNETVVSRNKFQKSSSMAVVNSITDKKNTEPGVPAVGQFLPSLAQQNQNQSDGFNTAQLQKQQRSASEPPANYTGQLQIMRTLKQPQP